LCVAEGDLGRAAFPDDEEGEKKGCEEDFAQVSTVIDEGVQLDDLQYIGTMMKAFLTGLLRRITPCSVIMKIMAPKQPVIP
jgi:hypothetical protein